MKLRILLSQEFVALSSAQNVTQFPLFTANVSSVSAHMVLQTHLESLSTLEVSRGLDVHANQDIQEIIKRGPAEEATC